VESVKIIIKRVPKITDYLVFKNNFKPLNFPVKNLELHTYGLLYK